MVEETIVDIKAKNINTMLSALGLSEQLRRIDEIDLSKYEEKE
jgi:hypothetical protein